MADTGTLVTAVSTSWTGSSGDTQTSSAGSTQTSLTVEQNGQPHLIAAGSTEIVTLEETCSTFRARCDTAFRIACQKDGGAGTYDDAVTDMAYTTDITMQATEVSKVTLVNTSASPITVYLYAYHA